MIKKTDRRQLAQALRHFVIGLINYEEYKKRIPKESKDIGVQEIIRLINDDILGFKIGIEDTECIHVYDKDIRLIGKYKLKPGNKRNFARWILFLYSDKEYRWFPWMRTFSVWLMFISLCCFIISLTLLHDNWSLSTGILGFFGLSLGIEIWGSYCLTINHAIDKYYWPFLRKADFRFARSHPIFLNRKSSH